MPHFHGILGIFNMETLNTYIDLIQSHPLGRIAIWLVVSSTLTIFFMLIRALAEKQVGFFSFLKSSFLSEYLVDLAKKTKVIFLFVLSAYITRSLINIEDPKVEVYFFRFFIILFGIQLVIWSAVWIQLFVDRVLMPKVSKGSEQAAAHLATLIFKIVLFAAILLFTLDNLGVNITALVTGLGVGGIAVALAVQNILGDLFSSLTIVLDKPFRVGDTITSGTESGTVENIGLKTTRVRSITGEELIFSNSDLLQSRIKNFKRMEKRRISVKVGVVYDTSVKDLKIIPQLIRDGLKTIEKVEIERVHLVNLADWSIDFECVYWVLSSDFTVYRDCHEKVLLNILTQLREKNIGIAFPTRTQINVSGDPVSESPLS